MTSFEHCSCEKCSVDFWSATTVHDTRAVEKTSAKTMNALHEWRAMVRCFQLGYRVARLGLLASIFALTHHLRRV